jgi:hypothetical protein
MIHVAHGFEQDERKDGGDGGARRPARARNRSQLDVMATHVMRSIHDEGSELAQPEGAAVEAVEEAATAWGRPAETVENGEAGRGLPGLSVFRVDPRFRQQSGNAVQWRSQVLHVWQVSQQLAWQVL